MSLAQKKTETPFEALKAKQQVAWSSGNYAMVGTTLQITGEKLCETMDLSPKSKVLDVAAGNGNATLAAARRFCHVTSTDYVDTLLKNGQARAEAEGHSIKFQVADAEALPFEDESFDAVMSTFGVMFTPDQFQAASEMQRVCRSGGKIAMANWTPRSFIGQVFKTLGKYIPPAPGVQSPALWGTEAHLNDLFGQGAQSITVVPQQFLFRYLSADHFLEIFRTYYGPIHKAFLALDKQGQAALDADLRILLEKMNIAKDGTLQVSSDYVDAVVVRA